MAQIDRLVRGVIVAPVALIIALAIGIGSVAGVILAAVAVIMAVTAAVGFCPLYRAIGVATGGRTVAHR